MSPFEVPPFEVLLPLVAIAFYLYDSAALLGTRELLFERQGKRWRVLGGSDFLLLGKRPVLPNPFTPWRPMFLVSWQDDAGAQVSSESAVKTFTAAESASPVEPSAHADSTFTIEALDTAMKPIQWIVSLLLALLFVAVPTASLLYGAGVALLTVFAAFYLLVLLAITFVIRRRQVFSLSGKECFALSMHVLLCAPFAVNLVRRLSWRWKLPASPVQFVNSRFDPVARREAIAMIGKRVDQALQLLDPDTPRAAQLQEFRQRLEGPES